MNNKPYLVPFRADHMLSFVNRDSSILEEMRVATRKEVGGPAFTAIFDGNIIGCAGVMLLWPGVGEAWVAFDKNVEKHGVWMTRTVRYILRDIIKGCRLHRVEAVVLTENTRNLRGIRKLGFTRENNCARQYTRDKKDVVRFEFLA